MKKILVTGVSSYIGNSFCKYMEQWLKQYQIDTVSMRDESWHEKSFAEYDCIFHVAGIAHSDNGKISEEKAKQYYEVNTDLTVNVAKKAKREGVRQFIFMSSAIVYGESAPIGERKVITRDTPPSPANSYGDSKLQAEKGICALGDENFKIVILRAPMIYGKGSKGNYPILSKLAQRCPLFPYVRNERSMLYIENLCEFVRLMIENEERGVFWPQNSEYSNTSEMVKRIAQSHGKRVYLVHGLEWMIKLMGHCTPLVNKAFGNMVYDQALSTYPGVDRQISLAESIQRTEI